MKRRISLLLAVSIVLSLLSACQPPSAESNPPASASGGSGPSVSGPAESEPPASAPAADIQCADVLTGIWRAGIKLAEGEFYGFQADDDREQLAAYIQGAYGLAEGEWEEACVARETGASAVELAVLRFADETAAQHGYDCLKDYLHAREGDFAGYAPAQARLVADAVLTVEGLYVGLFIVKDSELAGRTFMDIIETGEIPSPPPTPEPLDDVEELLEKLLACYELLGDDVSNLERIDGSDPDRLNSIIGGEYKLADDLWEEAAIARGTDGSAFEIAVLRVAEGQEAWRLCNVLTQDYLDVKEDTARFPAQAELLSKAIATNPNDTDFILLAVCGKPHGVAVEAMLLLGTNGYSNAQRHFETAPKPSLDPTPKPSIDPAPKPSIDPAPKPSIDPDPSYLDRVEFVQPGKEDMSLYDTSAIRAAWVSGSPDGLPDGDQAVYDAAEKILSEIIRDGMADLEKETAIYRWLVNNVDYDWRHQDIMMETPRTAYQPYGGLVDRMAVCLGYASSFQLLCDLAGVECITVVGAAFNSEEDHAWNMVRLGGQWYCVDVTWDANYREQGASSGQEKDWRWFNVTSGRMADTDHQWDYANTPEAAAEDHGRS